MLRKPVLLILLLFICPIAAYSQYIKILGVAERSNTVTVSGIASSTKAPRTFPLSTISIFYTGTTTVVPIYSDATGTVKANPFTADSFAQYDFYVGPGVVFDVRVSGTGVPSPGFFTRAAYTAPGGILGATVMACAGSNDTSILAAATGTIVIPSGVTCASNSQILSVPLSIQNGGLLKPNNAQTIVLTGYFGAGPYRVFSNATAGLGTVSFLGNSTTANFHPEWWTTNTTPGTTNMTTAVQAAADAADSRAAGSVLISTTYKITSTIVINTSTNIKGINLIGITPAGGGQSEFLWAGATNLPMIKTMRMKFGEISNIAFINSVARGTTIGLLLSGVGNGGENSANITIQNNIFQSFHVGLQAGDSTNAAAELDIVKNAFDLNDIGYQSSGGGNTLVIHLDQNFTDFNTQYGLVIGGGSGDTQVNGGTHTGNGTADIAFSLGWNRVLKIDGTRFELAGETAITNIGTGAGTVRIENCDFTGTPPATPVITGLGTFAINSNHFGAGSDTGWIPYDASQNSLGSVSMENNVVFGTTLFYIDPGNSQSNGMPYHSLGNIQFRSGAGFSRFPDEDGVVIWPNAIPLRKIQHGYVNAGSGARQVVQGIYGLGGASNTTPKNFRDNAAFATAATVAVTFKRTVADGAMTINTAVLTSATATFRVNDVGKTVTVANAGISGGTLTTFITGFTNSTTVTLADTAVASVSGKSTVIGEDEPDALYDVFFDGGINENFWATSKATAGFTLNSSNASSTSTVQWVLIRR